MPYFVSYQVKIKNRNYKTNEIWDIASQGAKYFFHFGNCLSWLNDKFNTTYENCHGKEGFFAWNIKNEKDFFHGLFPISNDNFLEKVLESSKLKEAYCDTNTGTL